MVKDNPNKIVCKSHYFCCRTIEFIDMHLIDRAIFVMFLYPHITLIKVY